MEGNKNVEGDVAAEAAAAAAAVETAAAIADSTTNADTGDGGEDGPEDGGEDEAAGGEQEDGVGAAEAAAGVVETEAPDGGGADGEGAAEEQEGAGEQISVELIVQPQGFAHQDRFSALETVGGVKSILGDKFKMDPTHIHLTTQAGDALQHPDTLGQYLPQGWSPEQPLALVMQIQYEEPSQADSDYKMPEIIEVSLGPSDPTDQNSPEQIVLVKVVRENLNREKPFFRRLPA